ncbi:MAG: M28 family peptidase [Gemmatimonadota bacterium]|nr:M28 family peptidase [Gemmatimonadota bacterium]
MITFRSASAAVLVLPALLAAQSALPTKHAPQQTVPPITATDLMTRLYILADDSMMGRRAGTEGNLKGTTYIESEVRRLGLVPAGDSGGYFQSLPMVRRELAVESTLSVDGQPLAMWTDFAPFPSRPGARSLDGVQAIFGGTLGDSTSSLTPAQAAGRFVVVRPPPGGRLIFPRVTDGSPLSGAAAVGVVGLDSAPPFLLSSLRRPQTTMRRQRSADSPQPPAMMLLGSRAAALLLGAPLDSTTKAGMTGKLMRGSISFTETVAPARNVVAILPGSDPRLRGEYVAIGAHNDHIGVASRAVDHDSLRAFNLALHRLGATDPFTNVTPAMRQQVHVNVDSLHRIQPARMDSISNGADDDGSGSVSVLEIAEALATAEAMPKRSILFVWHTGEELGMLGSAWFTDHPTVPRDSIVAQLNLDMVGRGGAEDIAGGGPRYLQLVGSRRLSTELGDLVETVNRGRRTPFTLDYSMDANGHPERIYCRSDHASYARYGIPVTFFTTGQHFDYHQVTDEPQYIDYQHMAAVAGFVHDVALRVANLDHRVVVDKPGSAPTAACVQ